MPLTILAGVSSRCQTGLYITPPIRYLPTPFHAPLGTFREELPVLKLELLLLVLLGIGLFLGSWGILGVRARRASRAWLGRRLCVSAVVLLGFSSWLAAFHRADGLAPLGLTAGLLLVAMLWEGPMMYDAEPQLIREAATDE